MRNIMRRLAGGMVVVVGLTITAVAVPASAAVSAPPPRPATDQARDRARTAEAAGPPVATVTLVTGDVVEVMTQPGGRQAATVVRGRPGMAYRNEIVEGDLSVVPFDAVALIDSGRLDPRLFNLSLLLRMKYDDANQADIPLLVSGGLAGIAARAKPVGGTDLRPLRTKKTDTTTFWERARGPAVDARTIVPDTTAIWLDGKVPLSLDRSRTQVGVPTAWAAGFTGAGVTVAVLDTGYDTRHPDLAGRVVASADFVADDQRSDAVGSATGVQDINGHGTHVASIVGGSGAASGGDYRGVAPGANLAIGRVCDQTTCAESAILAGMSWAVEQGAKVVNMSLGCSPRDCATDGTDPLAMAVNALSAQSGALFVVSAGNDGRDRFVSTPAVADAALAVGSVDRDDFLSGFSSRGPRLGDYAVKPDITAPGDGIIAARAAGAAPIGTPIASEYQAVSGTSMSAPHVAGAAAILAEQHPDWSGAQLKAALMSTSQVSPYTTAFSQGAGRLDVGRAVTQPVTADVGSLSFGNFTWPHTGQPPVARTVTYRNGGDHPVTLDLALSIMDSNWQPAPTGAFTLDRSTVTVPAHGSAAAVLTFDPHTGLELFNGYLTAMTADQAIRVSTAVSARSEDEQYNVTVTVRHRDGSLARDCTGSVQAVRRVDGFYENVSEGKRCTDSSGTVTIRTRPGHLALAASAFPLDEQRWTVSMSTVAFPDLAVTGDTSMVADARITKPVTASVSGEPTARQTTDRLFWYLGDGGQFSSEIGGPNSAYTATVGQPADDFTFAYRAAFAQPVATLRLAGGGEFALSRGFGGGLLLGERRTALVNGGTGSAADLAAIDPAGKVVLVNPTGDPTAVFAALAAAGAIAAIVSDLPARVRPTPLAVFGTSYYGRKDMLARLAQGPVAATTFGIRNSPYRYELVFTRRGNLPAGANYQVSRSHLAAVKSRFHQPGEEVVAIAPAWAKVPDGLLIAGGTPRLLLPADQTVYYTPAPFSWTAESALGDYGDFTGARMVNPLTTYQARKTSSESWYAGPVSPRLTAPFDANYLVPWAYRTGPWFGINLPLLSDANSDHLGMADPARRDYGYTTLSRDGVEVDYSPTPGQGFFYTPEPGLATYQLRTEVIRDVPPFWTLGTKVSTTWTFTADAGSENLESLPLLDVDWRLPVDATNRLPAGRGTDGELVIGQQRDSAPKQIATVSVQVSFDAGATWRWAAVTRAGDHWRVRLPGGGTAGGQVTLRVKAVASDATAVEETVERAYALR